jgi:hypothetical protein
MPETDKWKQLEQSLDGIFSRVNARADGYDLKFVKSLDGQRLVTLVYVNGEIKGEWYRADKGKPTHPEARFWCPHRRRAWPLKKHSELKKGFGKRKADQMTALEIVCFSPVWNNPRSLIQHFKKNFPDLEIMETFFHA